MIWQRGGLTVANGSVETGHLNDVKGDLYSSGKVSSHYRADRGDAVHATKRLTLTGNVVLVSADGKQTLTAPKGEYRGDVKLIRAMGGVQASGPFGTLTGIPEMWATPDLRLIGTPKMVSQILKIPALAILAATTASGAPLLQGKDYTISNYGDPVLTTLPTGQRLTLHPVTGAGPIVLTIPSRGMVIRSSQEIVLDFTPKNLEVRHMNTNGKVNIVQKQADGDTTTVDGSSAEYDLPTGSKTATLNVRGHITIVQKATVKDSKGKPFVQTTTTNGDSGDAVLLNKPAQGEDGLNTATLVGHVTIAVDGADDQKFGGSADRMVYTPQKELSGIEATGHVVLTSDSKTTGSDGKILSRRVVTKGESGTATLLAKPAPGVNPLREALLKRNVSIEVTGSNDQNFSATGDQLAYAGTDTGGKAVMTGDLEISGDTPLGNGKMTNVDVAVMTISKTGWETIEMSNSKGRSLETILKETVPPKAAPKTAPAKKKKGGPR